MAERFSGSDRYQKLTVTALFLFPIDNEPSAVGDLFGCSCVSNKPFAADRQKKSRGEKSNKGRARGWVGLMDNFKDKLG